MVAIIHNSQEIQTNYKQNVFKQKLCIGNKIPVWSVQTANIKRVRQSLNSILLV